MVGVRGRAASPSANPISCSFLDSTSRMQRLRLSGRESPSWQLLPDRSPPPPDPYLQAKRCLEIIVEALAECGPRRERVVRTRISLADAGDIDEVAPMGRSSKT